MDCELEVSSGGNIRIEEMGTFIVGWTLGNTGMVGKEVVEGIGRAKGAGKDYSWYFYSLPMLHWMAFETSQKGTSSDALSRLLSSGMSIMAVFAAEYAFNVFPATKQSSALLQISQFYLLFKICRSEVPPIEMDSSNGEALENETKKTQ